MSKKQNPETEQVAEFDLKHRITGAAVLLFLGALVLPWLLGPPSEASKVETSIETPKSSGIEPADIVIASNGSSSVSEVNEVEETVYISKITPLDARGKNNAETASNQVNERSKDVGSGQNGASKESSDALQEIVKEQNTLLESVAKESGDEPQKKQNELAEANDDSNKAKQEQAKLEQDLQAALAAEVESQKTKTNSIEVGWVVQVGLFTEKSRAIALISQLKGKGFEASSSVVDTNRGKNTGTRVWLGPFSKRVSAINEQKRLKSKAGKEGFIRVYP